MEHLTTTQRAVWKCSQPNTNGIRLLSPYQIVSTFGFEKRRIGRLWMANRYPNIKTELNKLTRHLKLKIAEFKADTFSSYTDNLPSEEGSLWLQQDDYRNTNHDHFQYNILTELGQNLTERKHICLVYSNPLYS